MPTSEDWDVLAAYVGGISVAGGKMKATGTEDWASPNKGATNRSGFSAFPGGIVTMMICSPVLALSVTGGVLLSSLIRIRPGAVTSSMMTKSAETLYPKVVWVFRSVGQGQSLAAPQ